MANPSGSSPSEPSSAPSARPTSSSTPRPAISAAAVSIPVTRSPSLVTTSPARRAVVRPAVVEDVAEPVPLGRACSGMKTTSSAPPRPCGKPWLPRSASVPLSSIVCTGLVCAASPSGARSVEGLSRARSRPAGRGRAPRARLASSMKLSVPRTSSSPQRPQFEQRSAAAAIAPFGVGAVELPPLCGRRRRTRERARKPPRGGATTVRHSGVAREDEMSDSAHQLDLYERRAKIDTAGVNLGSLDLNLLVALDALLQQRSVTRAAEQWD